VPENPAGLVYGSLAVATLLAAESARRETFARTIGAVAITILLYWFARSYAEFTGGRIKNRRAFSFSGLAAVARHELSVLAGGVVPLFIMALFWITGGSLDTAVLVTIWAEALLIVMVEFSTGLVAGLRGRELARQTAVGAVLGLIVLGLRILLH
jgi:hypothetical protein